VIVVLVLAACRRAPATTSVQQPAPTDAAGAGEAVLLVDAASPHQGAGEAKLAGNKIEVVAEAQNCWLAFQPPGEETQAYRLDLVPPCHLLLWQRPPPPKSNASLGEPVGNVGDVMAWRYSRVQGSAVFAVIGDPVPESMRDETYVERQRENFKCAGSLQGVVVESKRIRFTKKRSEIGILCAETGIEEKDFSIIAADKASRVPQ